MDPRAPRPSRPRSSRDGFSLVELMVTLVLLAVVVAVIATVMIGSQRSKAVTEGRLEAQQNARVIADILGNDIRSAGYQIDETATPPQRAFAYVDSLELVINANLGPFPDTLTLPVERKPLALNPAGAPIPPVLAAAPYAPTLHYGTGAETIRYTLDLDDDGDVDAADQSHPLAREAQLTANPDDFVLARAVYGDYTGSVALNNGGSKEKVGLVRGPGTGIPPMFTVYLGLNPLPWDWSDGPVPQDRLDEISRIELRVTTESRRRGPDGTFTRTTLTNEINSIRNVPTAGQTLYSVEGWVFDDLNRNLVKDAGEPGIRDAVIRMGTVSVATSSDVGFYRVSGPPGVYSVEQTVPEAYGAFGPSTISVNFVSSPADYAHDFADTARVGGWFVDTCYVDTDGSNSLTPGDQLVDAVKLTVGAETRTSDGAGGTRIFLSPGSHNVTWTAPESMMVVTTNPVTVAMSDGATIVHYTELVRATTGTVTGTVYLDINRNGTKDVSESGIGGVWVGVTKNAGATTLAFALTDASGVYSIQAPNNMPAATTPYEIVCIPPAGRYPTTPVQIAPIWFAAGETVSGQNFGMALYTQVTLNADRVLSLASGELLEKDWNGSGSQWASKAAFDKDLVLGSEYVSNPNISVWHNQWDPAQGATKVFTDNATYTRNALSSALSVAVGSLDGTIPVQRQDVVTGLARKASGCIGVWLNQNTDSNEGFLVTTPVFYQTQNAGDANVVVIKDFGGTSALDFIVGTTGATNQGTMETWINNGAGAFTRDEIYPPEGNLPSNTMGEVKAIVFADVVNDTVPDLIVGTKVAPGYGRVHVLGYNSRTPSNRYRHTRSFDVTGEVTCLVAISVDYDGYRDIVVGTRVSATAGNVQYWRNDGSDFTLVATFAAPGPVLSMTRGDFGGNAREDVVYGFRNNETDFTGGTRILYLDAGTLPGFDVDPAGGSHDWMAPSMTVNNFNYRLNPTTSGPVYVDLAVATKTGPTTGSLVVYFR